MNACTHELAFWRETMISLPHIYAPSKAYFYHNKVALFCMNESGYVPHRAYTFVFRITCEVLHIPDIRSMTANEVCHERAWGSAWGLILTLFYLVTKNRNCSSRHASNLYLGRFTINKTAEVSAHQYFLRTTPITSHLNHNHAYMLVQPRRIVYTKVKAYHRKELNSPSILCFKR